MLGFALARIVALLVLTASIALAATPTSFCKCICRGDYKIIPLDAPPPSSANGNVPAALFRARDGDDSDSDSDSPDDSKHGEYHHKTCADCNKVFCMEQNLPECKDAPGQEVSAQCFQRDSSKDEAVVFIFIFATVGLLTWAIIKPWADVWMEKVRERGQYIPVSSDGQ